MAKKIVTDLSKTQEATAATPKGIVPKNDGKAVTYQPIPGQVELSNDQKNDLQIKSQNNVPVEGAATSNDFTVGSDGRLYTGATTPIVDATIQKIQEFTDTATLARGPKGDKGDKGDPGPAGPRGPAGPKGDDGVVDYDLLRDIIKEILDDMLNMKQLKYIEPVPTQIFGTKTARFPTELVDPLTNTRVTVVPTYQLGRNDLGTIAADGWFTAADITVDTPLTITANYTDERGKNYTVQTNVLIKALKPQSLTVTGPSSINSGGTGLYSATVIYTDGTSRVVTGDAALTWSIQSGNIGTLSSNVLTASAVTANTTGTIRASYVEKGITVAGTINVTIVAPQIMPFYGAAAHPVASGSADPATYQNWGTFVTSLSGRATNASKVNTFTISQGVGQYGWYAYPKSFGLMDQAKIKGNGQPGPGGWDSAQAPNTRTGSFWGVSGPLEVTVQVNGANVQFYLYRTDNMPATTQFTETWVVSN
jgi:hypothetical protein